jgi:hypothetical protein
MPEARTIDLASAHALSSGTVDRARTAPRRLLLAAAIAALATALLGTVYLGTRHGAGYPDVTQQWTD